MRFALLASLTFPVWTTVALGTTLPDTTQRRDLAVLRSAPAQCNAFGLTPQYAARERRQAGRRAQEEQEALRAAQRLHAAVLAAQPAAHPNTASTPRPVSPTELVRASAGTGIVVTSAVVAANEQLNARKYSFYDPEGHLIAETETTTAPQPAIEWEYIWFGGEPLAQIRTATGEIAWYFDDHLGTPILQTDASGNVLWRAEYEPIGGIFATRAGEGRHQPLRFPGQENDGATDLSYNVFRWYRSSWGRYTQVDALAPGGLGHFERGRMSRFKSPIAAARERFLWENGEASNPAGPGVSWRRPVPMGLSDATNPYAYAADSPVMYTDPLGLAPCLTFSINPKADYVPAGPPGKMFKGCQYIGECYGSIVVYEDSDVTFGCKCKQFCLMNIEPVSSIPIGPSLCFNMPPWWAWSPPLIKP